MQEAADPITKLVWGNAALISPAMAREKGWKDGDMVALSRGNLKAGGRGHGPAGACR